MITDGEKWHYLAVKSLPALHREKTSETNGYFYCLNCLHSFRTENKIKKGLKYCDDPKLQLNIQMICKMFIKILKNTIQEKSTKF